MVDASRVLFVGLDLASHVEGKEKMTRLRLELVCVLFGVLASVLKPLAHGVSINIDYTYDSLNFFGAGNPDGSAAGQQARDSLEEAATYFSNLLDDSFSTIVTPPDFYSQQFNGIATWNWTLNFNDPSSNVSRTLTNQTIPADEYRVYAGARNISGTTLGIGGPGGWDISTGGNGGRFTSGEINQVNQITDDFFDTVELRGELTGFANWGGAVTFDTPGTNWHYNHNSMSTFGTSDFFSVALHEIGHAVGLGTSDEWNSLVSGSNFTGSASVAEHGGLVPLDCGGGCGHWAENTMSTVNGESQKAAMDPSVTDGTRKLFTDLDLAGLEDIGWTVSAPITEIHNWITTTLTGDWGTSTNWNPPGTPGALWDARLHNTTTVEALTAVVNNDSTVNRVTISGTDSPMTVAIGGGTALTVTNGIQVNAGGAVSGGGTINGHLTNDGGQTIAAAETLTVNDLVTLNDVELSVSFAYSQTRGTQTGVFTVLTSTNMITGTFSTPAGNGAASHMGRGHFLVSITHGTNQVDINVLAAKTGDTDGDLDVDITDFSVLAENYDPSGSSGYTWKQADFDNDFDIDITDFNLLSANYAPDGYAADNNAIPEPTGLALVLLGVFIYVAWERLNRKS